MGFIGFEVSLLLFRGELFVVLCFLMFSFMKAHGFNCTEKDFRSPSYDDSFSRFFDSFFDGGCFID